MRTCAPHLSPRMCAAWSLTRRIFCRRSSTAFARITAGSGRSSSRCPSTHRCWRSPRPLRAPTSATSPSGCACATQNACCFRSQGRILNFISRKITVQGKTGKTRKLQNARLRLLDDVLRKLPQEWCDDYLLPCVKDVKRTTKWLRSRNYPVKAYHGKMRRRKRAHVQDYFLTKRARSSWPRTPSVWALTVPTCGWSCTPDCPSVSMRTRRKSAAPDATEKGARRTALRAIGRIYGEKPYSQQPRP